MTIRIACTVTCDNFLCPHANAIGAGSIEISTTPTADTIWTPHVQSPPVLPDGWIFNEEYGLIYCSQSCAEAS